MTKMTGLFLGAALLLPVAASADVDLNFLVVDGGPNTTVEKGDTVKAQVTFETDGEDVESFSWMLVGSDMPPICVNTVDATSDDGGTFVRSFDIVLGNNPEGEYDVELRSFGDNGANASQQCASGDENSDASFDDRITIFDEINDNQDDDNDNNENTGDNFGGNNGGNSTGGSGSSNSQAITALQNQIAALIAQLAGLTGVVAGMAPDAICAQAPADTGSLQTFLVGQNLMTSAEVATGPGIYGPKTTRAHNAFKAMHKCR